MAITKKKWWYGTEPKDLEEYLNEYTQGSYEMNEFRLAECSCGSKNFLLEVDADEGVAKRTCTECNKDHFLIDSEEFYQEAEPEKLFCPGCGGVKFNVAGGYSFDEDEEEDEGYLRWFYLGERCVDCGLLGSSGDWEVGYGPARELLDQI